MFWVDFAFGVVATVVFLLTEHLMGQLIRQKCVGVLKLFYPAGEMSKPDNWGTKSENETAKVLGKSAWCI